MRSLIAIILIKRIKQNKKNWDKNCVFKTKLCMHESTKRKKMTLFVYAWILRRKHSYGLRYITPFTFRSMVYIVHLVLFFGCFCFRNHTNYYTISDTVLINNNNNNNKALNFKHSREQKNGTVFSLVCAFVSALACVCAWKCV